MSITEFVIIALATHRLTWMLYAEECPANLCGRLRSLLAGVPIARDIMACPFCLSVWVAALLLGVFALPYGFWLLVVLAAADVSLVISSWRGEVPPIQFEEQETETAPQKFSISFGVKPKQETKSK